MDFQISTMTDWLSCPEYSNIITKNPLPELFVPLYEKKLGWILVCARALCVYTNVTGALILFHLVLRQVGVRRMFRPEEVSILI